MIYLDNNSTTRVDDSVSKIVTDYMVENYGNSSCVHDFGLKSDVAVKKSRHQVAGLINCNFDEVFFTSGSTESNNWIIRNYIESICSYGTKPLIATTPIEHPSILEPLNKFQKMGMCRIYYFDLDELGRVVINLKTESILKNDVALKLISVMLVNNETGIIQDIKSISNRFRRICPIHSDITQAIGKIDVDVVDLGVSFASMSAHKYHGPKGCGAMYIKKGKSLNSFILGGGQQDGARSGTLNVPGIAGMGEASYICKRDFELNSKHMKKLSNMIYDSLVDLEGIVINSDRDFSVSNTINISFPEIDTKNMLDWLSKREIYVSGGSACSSRKIVPSYVIKAMGKSDNVASKTIRISLSKYNTEEEVIIFIDCLKEYLRK